PTSDRCQEAGRCGWKTGGSGSFRWPARPGWSWRIRRPGARLAAGRRALLPSVGVPQKPRFQVLLPVLPVLRHRAAVAGWLLRPHPQLGPATVRAQHPGRCAPVVAPPRRVGDPDSRANAAVLAATAGEIGL